MARRGLGAVAVALGVIAVALLLAGCGTNDYRYVDNSKEGAYFKVPSGWELYRVKAQETTDRLAAPQTSGPWHVVFDSAKQPDVAHAEDVRPEAPVGQAFIFEIQADQGDQLSPADLRGAFLGEDPVSSTSSDVEVVNFTPLSYKSGIHGSRVLFNRNVGNNEWVTTDHTTLINAEGTKVYVFEVKADAKAFKADAKMIQQIVDSWQVKS
jgi:hypothetical protein